MHFGLIGPVQLSTRSSGTEAGQCHTAFKLVCVSCFSLMKELPVSGCLCLATVSGSAEVLQLDNKKWSITQLEP